MNSAEFFKVLRGYFHAKPFVPFEVELFDGRVIEVEQPSVVFDETGGAYITEDIFVTFECGDVRAMRRIEAGAKS